MFDTLSVLILRNSLFKRNSIYSLGQQTIQNLETYSKYYIPIYICIHVLNTRITDLHTESFPTHAKLAKFTHKVCPWS